MKTLTSKKLILKKVTVCIYKIRGAGDTSTGNTNSSPSQSDSPTDKTLSSAYNDPTENPINPLYLSFDAGICA